MLQLARRLGSPNRRRRGFGLAMSLLGGLLGAVPAQAQTAQVPDKAAIERLLPELEAQVARGMKELGVPGLAIGIVHDDALVYSKGFGVKEAGKPEPVTAQTLFQIGSTTKAFFATTLAQAVDAGRLKWTDAVGDHLPAFQLADPWVSRDFRILDLAAQRSGLTSYVNDGLTFLGFDKATLIRSMRAAPQLGLFRSDFRYLNIPHLAGGEIVAAVNGTASWFDSAKTSLLAPLGMAATSATPEAIAQAPDHASGHRPEEPPAPVPFHGAFPYALGPAGAFNSNVPDLANWLRLQLGRGHFDGKVIVSEENLDVTWTPRVALNERLSYAVGWIVSATPQGRVIWHNGGTVGFGAHLGFLPDHRTGIVILSNFGNPVLADALGLWFADRVLGNPGVDNIALAAAGFRAQRAREKQEAERFVVGPAPSDPAAFTGSYVSDILGEATVSAADGRLRLTLERTEAVLSLEPHREDPTLFQARLLPEAGYAGIAAVIGPDPLLQLRFERSVAGRIERMRWLNPELPHVFARAPAP